MLMLLCVDGTLRVLPYASYALCLFTDGRFTVGMNIKVAATGERPLLTKDGKLANPSTKLALKNKAAQWFPGVPLSNLLFVLFTCLLGTGLGIWVATQ